MRSIELPFAIDAKRVVPNYPTPAGQAQLPLHQQFEFRSIFVANRQPERPRGRQDTDNFRHPILAPTQIFFALQTILIDIVGIVDIEWWIGKYQIHCFCRQSPQAFKTVTAMDLNFSLIQSSQLSREGLRRTLARVIVPGTRRGSSSTPSAGYQEDDPDANFDLHVPGFRSQALACLAHLRASQASTCLLAAPGISSTKRGTA